MATNNSINNTDLNLTNNQLLDPNGNPWLFKNSSSISSAVNYFQIQNSATGNAPALGVAGSDPNISLLLETRGTGSVSINPVTAGTQAAALNLQNTISGNPGGYVGLTIPTGTITSYSLTFPAAAPVTSGSYPSVTTGGIISWYAPTAPTKQEFDSSSGTYTTPTSPAPLYIRVRMIGGGGGGGGGGTSASGTTPGAGTNTTFGSSGATQMIAGGGGAGVNATDAGGGGTGGTNTIGSLASEAFSQIGGQGGGGGVANGSATNYTQPGMGGSGYFGGGGGSAASALAGGAGATNSGGGGGGGGSGGTITENFAGTGGGAGGYVEFTINSPAATYAYAVGGGGSAGGAGTDGYVGGAGAAGRIVVWEYYQ